MMANKSESDKSQYWDRVLTVDISDVVFIHWHHKGMLVSVVHCVVTVYSKKNQNIKNLDPEIFGHAPSKQ